MWLVHISGAIRAQGTWRKDENPPGRGCGAGREKRQAPNTMWEVGLMQGTYTAKHKGSVSK